MGGASNLAYAAAGRPAHQYARVPCVGVCAVLQRRAVPVAYYAGQQAPGSISPHRAWTAPYWYSPWWADCVTPKNLES